jgi:small subunit ribosomal protein S20
MAKRTASAKKQARAGAKRSVRNRAVRSEVKTKVVKARRSLAESPIAESDRYALTLDAVRALDRAAAKGILHRNNAARRKARLTRQMAKLAIAPAPAAKGKKGGAAAGSGGAVAAARRPAVKPAAGAKKK